MLYRIPTHAKNQMLKKCNHDLSSNQHTEKVMKYKKKLRRKVNMLQCPSSLTEIKTNEFQNELFLKPYSYYEYRGDNLQHSVVSNNETQSRNSRAVALSTHARLRFNSSTSLLPEYRSLSSSLLAMDVFILLFLF